MMKKSKKQNFVTPEIVEGFLKSRKYKYLNDQEIKNVLDSGKTSLSVKNIDEVIFLLGLSEKISNRYSEETEHAYQYATRGLRYGLHKYKENRLGKEASTQLLMYLTWHMKTSIEKHLGWINEDTENFPEEALF